MDVLKAALRELLLALKEGRLLDATPR